MIYNKIFLKIKLKKSKTGAGCMTSDKPWILFHAIKDINFW